MFCCNFRRYSCPMSDPNEDLYLVVGVAFGDDRDGGYSPWCLSLHSLRSFRCQVPRVTQRSPFGCFATFFFPFWSAAYPTVTLRVFFWFYFACMTLPLMKGVGVTFLLYRGGNSVFLFTFAR